MKKLIYFILLICSIAFGLTAVLIEFDLLGYSLRHILDLKCTCCIARFYTLQKSLGSFKNFLCTMVYTLRIYIVFNITVLPLIYRWILFAGYRIY